MQRGEFWLHQLSEGGGCCLCTAIPHRRICRCLWHAYPCLCWMRLWPQDFLHEKQMECQSLPSRIQVSAESESVILSDLIGIDWFLSSVSFSLLQSIHSFTSEMQFCILGQWCPNGLDDNNQEVECHQQKTDWRLSDVRSSLKMVLCTKWLKQGRGQSPAAHQSRERLVLNCCCRWSPFESF